jgi:hypothetical protein
MVRLLGVLPPPEEFGDGDQAISESADSIDCQTTSSLAMYQDPSMIPSCKGKQKQQNIRRRYH